MPLALARGRGRVAASWRGPATGMIRHRASGPDQTWLPRTIGRVTGRRFHVWHGVTTGATCRAAARWLAVTCAVCTAIAGCGLVGGTKTGSFDVPEIITVSSLAFRDQGEIPDRYTCLGKGISPPIHWSGVPTGTKALALVVDDSDAPITP